jgi:hypothetical protein
MRTEVSINKRIDELLLVMKSEKDLVDSNFGNWDLVDSYLFKSKSTMKALRKYVNYSKRFGKVEKNIILVCNNCYSTRMVWETVCPNCSYVNI